MGAPMSDVQRIPVAEIRAQLEARIVDLARELAPVKGYVEKDDWVALNPTRADRHPGSFRIQIRGVPGRWKDYATDDGGDVIDLISYLVITSGAGGYKVKRNRGLAILWAKRWLGLEEGRAFKPSHANFDAEKARKTAEEEERRKKRARAGLAKRIFFDQGKPLKGTPAERYLMGRAIDFSRLGRYPGALRFVPALKDPWEEKLWPALVAAIAGDLPPDANGEVKEGIIGLHRTFLKVQPSGEVTKAPLPEGARASLGAVLGGTIRLWRGKSNKPLKEAPGDDVIVLCEGIEDGLAIAQDCPDYRVLASVTLGNMGAVSLPGKELIIFKDNDTHPQSLRAFEKVLAHHQRQGKRVRVAASPVGKDANDLARAIARQGQEERKGA